MHKQRLQDLHDQLAHRNPKAPDNLSSQKRYNSPPTQDPTRFHMNSWSSTFDCGTSACLGGWAATFHPDLLTFDSDGELALAHHHQPAPRPDGSDLDDSDPFDAFALAYDIPPHMASRLCSPTAYNLTNPPSTVDPTTTSLLPTVLARLQRYIDDYSDLDINDNFTDDH